jgi:tRNA(fMet)-specific endonuclease VapC
VKRYLLDTNVLSAVVKDPDGLVSSQLEAVAARSDGVYTSVIVAAELRFGVSRLRSVRLAQRVERVLSEIRVASFAAPADRVYADLRAELERRGTPIGANDLWIAAQALHDGSVLVTDNVSEFSRVPGLTVENWLRPQAR